MINAIQAWIMQDSFIEKEIVEQRDMARAQIADLLNGINYVSMPEELDQTDARERPTGTMPGIVYDEFGKPRPARIAYDSALSDDPPQQRQRPRLVQPLPPETVPTDDFDNPFPGLDPPVG